MFSFILFSFFLWIECEIGISDIIFETVFSIFFSSYVKFLLISMLLYDSDSLLVKYLILLLLEFETYEILNEFIFFFEEN